MSAQTREPTLEEQYLERSGWERQGDTDSWVDRRFGAGRLPEFSTQQTLDMQRRKDLRHLALMLDFGSVESLVDALIPMRLYPASR